MANHSPRTTAPSTVSAESARRSAPDSLQAVLWDMDGTIVDTEPYWIAAEKELVGHHGGTWSTEEASALVGQSLEFSAGVLQAAGVALSVRQIIDHLIGEVTQRVRVEVPWRPGARELLLALNECGVPCVMVTMSEQLLAREVAGQLPDGTFEFLVTGDMVSRGKPDPESYQMAFERLSVGRRLRKERVVAIEDSLPGVTAAQASGVVTVAVPHFIPIPADSGRHVWTTLEGRTVEDLDNLVARLMQGATP